MSETSKSKYSSAEGEDLIQFARGNKIEDILAFLKVKPHLVNFQDEVSDNKYNKIVVYNIYNYYNSIAWMDSFT